MSTTQITSGDTSSSQSSVHSTPKNQFDDTKTSFENQTRTVPNEEKLEQNPSDEFVTGYEHNYVTGIARWLILGPVTLTYFTFFLDLAVLSTATPAITSEFNSLTDIGWYGGAYQLGSAAFQPMAGKLFRYFSIKVSSTSIIHIKFYSTVSNTRSFL